MLYVYGWNCAFWFFFFKQKTAYEMRISDWSSYVCSSDLSERYAIAEGIVHEPRFDVEQHRLARHLRISGPVRQQRIVRIAGAREAGPGAAHHPAHPGHVRRTREPGRDRTSVV